MAVKRTVRVQRFSGRDPHDRIATRTGDGPIRAAIRVFAPKHGPNALPQLLADQNDALVHRAQVLEAVDRHIALAATGERDTARALPG